MKLQLSSFYRVICLFGYNSQTCSEFYFLKIWISLCLGRYLLDGATHSNARRTSRLVTPDSVYEDERPT